MSQNYTPVRCSFILDQHPLPLPYSPPLCSRSILNVIVDCPLNVVCMGVYYREEGDKAVADTTAVADQSTTEPANDSIGIADTTIDSANMTVDSVRLHNVRYSLCTLLRGGSVGVNSQCCLDCHSVLFLMFLRTNLYAFCVLSFIFLLVFYYQISVVKKRGSRPLVKVQLPWTH